MSSHKDRKTKSRTKATKAAIAVAWTASKPAGASKSVSRKLSPKATSKAAKVASAATSLRSKAKVVAAKAKLSAKVKSKPELSSSSAASSGPRGKVAAKQVRKSPAAAVKSKAASAKSVRNGNARPLAESRKMAASAAKTRGQKAGTVEGNSGKMSDGKSNGAQASRSKTNGASGRATATVHASNGNAPASPAVVAVMSSGEAGVSGIAVPPGYRPMEGEPFMSERQRAYFRTKLIAWKEEIVRQNRETLQGLHEDSVQHADLADRATFETDRALELRARDRQRKLIAKIDSALSRIEDRSYGYCEETGEPISLKRLDARPIATLSIEGQERHERRERVFREE